ncbi:MAG: hypothetical protein HWE35_07045 [Rhodobacteraceae bacterium]|nr:hypothetical protein [Paracoccaceae bacterium]
MQNVEKRLSGMIADLQALITNMTQLGAALAEAKARAAAPVLSDEAAQAVKQQLAQTLAAVQQQQGRPATPVEAQRIEANLTGNAQSQIRADAQEQSVQIEEMFRHVISQLKPMWSNIRGYKHEADILLRQYQKGRLLIPGLPGLKKGDVGVKTRPSDKVKQVIRQQAVGTDGQPQFQPVLDEQGQPVIDPATGQQMFEPVIVETLGKNQKDEAGKNLKFDPTEGIGEPVDKIFQAKSFSASDNSDLRTMIKEACRQLFGYAHSEIPDANSILVADIDIHSGKCFFPFTKTKYASGNYPGTTKAAMKTLLLEDVQKQAAKGLQEAAANWLRHPVVKGQKPKPGTAPEPAENLAARAAAYSQQRLQAIASSTIEVRLNFKKQLKAETGLGPGGADAYFPRSVEGSIRRLKVFLQADATGNIVALKSKAKFDMG